MKSTITQNLTLPRTLLACAVALSVGAAGSARADTVAQLALSTSSAAAHRAASAGINVEQRLREELRVVMAGLIENGAFGDQPPQQISLDVDSPAQHVSDLGLLVDSARRDPDGLHVLAVTPGSSAERMGLRAGDVLVALNGASLASAEGGAAMTLRHTVDTLPNGSPLAFDARRDGHLQTVSGTLSSVYVPAMRLTVGNGTRLASNTNVATGTTIASQAQGCGRVSDFDTAPRQQHLHAARIISIDGVTPGPTGTKSFRVEAGTHTLKVAEDIESRYLGFGDRQRNSRLASERYKTLTLDVAPDTTVLIAARLNEDKRDEPSDGVYWDPVAWKQVAEACR